VLATANRNTAVAVEERNDKQTACEPNFFIIGAAKAGTTSLYHYLRQHPDVFMPEESKEPWHFCAMGESAPLSAEQYSDFSKYLGLFAGAGGCRAIGEASVSYLVSAGAEERIYERYPDARIIVVLRNPADRVYSWYNFLCQYGVEPGLSLEDALADELRRAGIAAERRDTWFADECILYFNFGLISHHIERWVKRFPRNQIQFLLFDDLKARPKETTREVFEFLGVDASVLPSSFKVHNPTWFPLSVGVQHAFASRSRLHPFLPNRGATRFFDRRVIPWVCWINAVLGQVRTRRFNPSTRRSLLNRYRDDIRRTEQLVGRSLEPWLKGV
jgi:sulfotransferase family protein